MCVAPGRGEIAKRRNANLVHSVAHGKVKNGRAAQYPLREASFLSGGGLGDGTYLIEVGQLLSMILNIVAASETSRDDSDCKPWFSD